MERKQLFFIGALFLAQVSWAQESFHLIKKTVIGGEGGWDYLSVDSKSSTLYISHSTQVEVLDAKTYEKKGVIPGLQGVHGVIAVPSSGRGITTNGRSNSATIFDLKTLKPIVEVPTGKNPDALLYDSFSKRVFTFNHSDVTATAIDIENGKVVGTVDLGGTALEAGATDEKGTIFVNLEDASEIVSFDARTLVMKDRWKLSPCEEPTGLALDMKNNRLFSVCHNGMMMVVDSKSGKIIAQVPIGKRVDGAAFDPELKMAFSSNGEGTITVVKEVSPNEFKVIQTIETAVGARTIALDPVTHHLFVSTAQYGETPAATAENPNPRPKIVPGTFMVLEYGMK
ncbi:MAG: YncE family protein [Bacteroidetes bacterium]|nr:YncE family protein [Bacteroidota bacterium]